MISCTPEFVTDLSAGGENCVSRPITYNHSLIEGEPGSMEYELNSLVDDNGVSFMNVTNLLGKRTGVSVTRTGQIKTKGGCEYTQGGPASCSGEYEIIYSISFDAPHTSGDVPELIVMHSGLKVNDAASIFTSSICPIADFPQGCETPLASALGPSIGNIYEGSYLETALEETKGSQPDGFVVLHYECESDVTVMPSGSMLIEGNKGTFDETSFVSNMIPGQWLRFSSTPGNDHYEQIDSTNETSGIVTLRRVSPFNGSYVDVEYGTYFSDWAEDYGSSGVSNECLSARFHSTLAIDISIGDEFLSVSDWESKLKGLSVIDSTGIVVSRKLAHLSDEIGYIWMITFLKQPGNVNQLSCTSTTNSQRCDVSTVLNSSMITGTFELETTWPHEYETSNISTFGSNKLQWNIEADELRSQLESIVEDDNKVFGSLNITRYPYKPPSHLRWAGAYSWSIEFTSRAGNVPRMTYVQNLNGVNVYLEVADEDSGQEDTFQGSRDSYSFSFDDPGTAIDGNQVSGSFGISWRGNDIFDYINTSEVFNVQTGGEGNDRFTAMSAERMLDLMTEHMFANFTGMVEVTRLPSYNQVMGYTYCVVFVHEDVGGDIALMKSILPDMLKGKNTYVNIEEKSSGTSLLGTFRLRFNGESTRAIAHDATAQDVEGALNELLSISPSVVMVSRTNALRTGPSTGIGGKSTQVGGYTWLVTFTSHIWREPTASHNFTAIPGNWIGEPALQSDTWDSGFSKAWGKNVGNVPSIECVSDGLYTTNGLLPSNGCVVSEIIQGTDPLAGKFQLCLDTSDTNSSMSVSLSDCTELIDHNAPARGNDGSSMEEKLEALSNIGNIHVERSAVNVRNGGYTWTVTFLHDVDGPCEQKDDLYLMCNSPGNVPKLCSNEGISVCDTSSLLGSCSRPGQCTKLTILDESDFIDNVRPPAMNEIQKIAVIDSQYLGWTNGSIIESTSVSQYRLVVNGIESSCIRHDASPEVVQSSIQAALDASDGGHVHVTQKRFESEAPNGFIYLATFYDSGDIDEMVPLYSSSTSTCPFSFGPNKSVQVMPILNGQLHPTTCEYCQDGRVNRGSLTRFESAGFPVDGVLPWNAHPIDVKTHLQQSPGLVVDVERTILDKFGNVQWIVTFVGNSESVPPGSGDIQMLIVEQETENIGSAQFITVQEIQKGSEGMGGHFSINYSASNGPLNISFSESPQSFMSKMNTLSTIGEVYVTREKYPSEIDGGWGDIPASNVYGGYEWKIYFVKNLGISDGYSFPAGSGNVMPPSIDANGMLGREVRVEFDKVIEGSEPIEGSFRLELGGESSDHIPHFAPAEFVEKVIDDLNVIGPVTVSEQQLAMHKIEGIKITAVKDQSRLLVSGGNIMKHLAPGDLFRIGRSNDSFVYDGSVEIGKADVIQGSPFLISTEVNGYTVEVGQRIKLGGDFYNVRRNGLEIQQIVVHRVKGMSNIPFYRLNATINGHSEESGCLNFEASANDIEDALNGLSIIGTKGVYVTKSSGSDGFIGNAHFYKVYFRGSKVAGNIAQLEALNCTTSPTLNNYNSHIAIKTLVQGGSVEHQRISLSSDSGYVDNIPAFQVIISYFDDSSVKSFSSGCIEWGEPVLGLDYVARQSVRVSSTYNVLEVVKGKDESLFVVTADGFIEGVIGVEDILFLGGSCEGIVQYVQGDGTSFLLKSSDNCDAVVSGEAIEIVPDVTILEHFSGKKVTRNDVTTLTTYSDRPVVSNSNIFKIEVEFRGVTRQTSCLPFGVEAKLLENELGSLFDYDLNGIINTDDIDHLYVTREGDGTKFWAYGYVYHIESRGESLFECVSFFGFFRQLFALTFIYFRIKKTSRSQFCPR